MLNSSWVEPSTTGTRLNCPLSNAALIDCGSTLPSTFGTTEPAVVGLVREQRLDRKPRRQAAVWSLQPDAVGDHACPRPPPCASDGSDERIGAALRDRAVEEARRERRRELRVHAQPAGRLAEDRHVVRVAAELRDVALHPAQRGLLVHQAVVAGAHGRATPALSAGCARKPEPAEPVVDRDDDRALLDEPRRVVVVALADRQRAAVDPDHHRQVLGVAAARARGSA